MKAEEAISCLEKELLFEPRTASAYVRAHGKCEYCDCDLITDRQIYACAEIDHLLPRAHYEDKDTGIPENFVLSCSLCNRIKGKVDVLRDGEEPKTMLANHRKKLVERAQKIVLERKRDADIMWERAKEIFSDLE